MVVEVQLSNLSADTDEECGVIFRANDSDNCFAAYLDDGDDLVHLSKFVAGAWTPSDTAELRVIAQSSRIRVWVDFILRIDTTDSSFSSSTKAGLFSRSTTVVNFANFYAQGL